MSSDAPAYAPPTTIRLATTPDTEIVARITVDLRRLPGEAYPYRRAGAALRHQGIVANGGAKLVHPGLMSKTSPLNVHAQAYAGVSSG